MAQHSWLSPLSISSAIPLSLSLSLSLALSLLLSLSLSFYLSLVLSLSLARNLSLSHSLSCACSLSLLLSLKSSLSHSVSLSLSLSRSLSHTKSLSLYQTLSLTLYSSLSCALPLLLCCEAYKTLLKCFHCFSAPILDAALTLHTSTAHNTHVNTWGTGVITQKKPPALSLVKEGSSGQRMDTLNEYVRLSDVRYVSFFSTHSTLIDTFAVIYSNTYNKGYSQ